MCHGAKASSQWAAIKGAAIPGHNHKQFQGTHDLAACKRACDQTLWCKSFEHYGRNCQLSCKRARDVSDFGTEGGNYQRKNAFWRITYYERFTGKTVLIPNAALKGHNRKSLYRGQTVASCTQHCIEEPWCKSFDWHASSGSCFFNDKKASDVGGLKHDYSGNPLDYYELAPRTHLSQLYEGHQAMAPSPVTQSAFVGAFVGAISLGGIAMGVIAFRRGWRRAGQTGHDLLDRDDEHIQLEEHRCSMQERGDV